MAVRKENKMEFRELERIDKYKHLSQYDEIQLYTKVCLYEPILISTNDIILKKSTERKDVIEVCASKDIVALEKLWKTTETILLPCAYCGENRPFTQIYASNPRHLLDFKKTSEKKPALMVPLQAEYYTIGDNNLKKLHNAFHPEYTFGNSLLIKLESNSEFLINGELLEPYRVACASLCANTILSQISSIHKDLTCTLSGDHWAFIEFIIKPAVDNTLWERIQAEESKIINEQGTMPESLIKAKELYNRHKHSLLLVKVGQYPSLQNMLLYDYRKYRNILGNRYADYTLSLSLFSDGIGAGSFVYFRRILESFVEEEHQKCLKKSKNGELEEPFNEEGYNKLRFNEKMMLLQDKYGVQIIPDELEDIRNEIYGVLSKGVHEYTEEECINKYPAIKYIIDSIIEEKIQRKEREKKLTEIKNTIRKP